MYSSMLKTKHSFFITVCLLVILVISGTSLGASASVTAGSSGLFTKATDSSWNNIWASQSNAAARAATVTWELGANMADGATIGPTAITETKFIPAQLVLPVPVPPIHHDFTGSTLSIVGVCDSTAVSTGLGWSVATPYGHHGLRNPIYFAKFHIIATGHKGTPKPGIDAEYNSNAKAYDPWNIYADDLSSITTDNMDIYVPVELSAASLSVDDGPEDSGFLNWSISYETANETVSLLEINYTSGTLSVAINPLLDLYYLADPAQPDSTLMGNNLSDDAEDMISHQDLVDMLTADLANDDVLDNPIPLGLSMNGMEIPTESFGDGQLASLHFDIEAAVEGQATIPEPASLFLLGLGAAGLAVLKRG